MRIKQILDCWPVWIYPVLMLVFLLACLPFWIDSNSKAVEFMYECQAEGGTVTESGHCVPVIHLTPKE